MSEQITPEIPPSDVRHVTMVIQRFRPAFSGQGVQVEELCRTLARRGVRSTILAAAAAGDPDSHERLDGYEVVRLAASPIGERERRHSWTVRFARRAFRYLWRHARRTDVMHVHGLTDALYAAWAVGRLRRVPVTMEMTLLGDDDPVSVRDSTLRMAGLRYALYRRCDGYVAMSGAFLPAYRRCSMPEERLRLIPQGVDLQRFRTPDASERVAARHALAVPENAEVVCFVGSLVRRKGLDLLLGVWNEVATSRPHAHLLLAGPDRFDDAGATDDLASWLQALTPEVAARTHRLGRLDDTVRVLHAADLFAFPSRREGFGSVIIEAMACGLPVIVAELPGITDLIFGDDAEARGGIVFDQEDGEALGVALRRLLADPVAGSRLGAAARRRAAERFGFDTIAGEYLEWYAQLRRQRGLSA